MPSAEGARFRRNEEDETPLGWEELFPTLPLPSWWRRLFFTADQKKVCFPIPKADLRALRKSSFAEPRGKDDTGKYQRCHAGQDILSRNEGPVRAIAAGVVRNEYHFTTCGGGATRAVLVWHEELGITVNYGEIDTGHVKVAVGDTVTRGQLLGDRTKNCGMLHLEIYDSDRTANIRWPAPSPSTDKALCRAHEPPRGIRNPYELLNSMVEADNFCGAS